MGGKATEGVAIWGVERIKQLTCNVLDNSGNNTSVGVAG